MGNIVNIREPRRDFSEKFCCECGAPATNFIRLQNIDTGEDVGIKCFCGYHGPNTPLGATMDKK
jgi:hypothetical protein